MKKHIQTRNNNCYPTCAACIMDLDSPEDAIQIQEYYDDLRWNEIWTKWLARKGYVIYQIFKESIKKDEFYIASGKSPRGDFNHVCIYQNGKLFHDPHPDGLGILTEDYYEIIEKLN